MHVRISDQKMKDLLCLINGIPLPQNSSVQSPERLVSGCNENAKSLYICIYDEFCLAFCELFYFSIFLGSVYIFGALLRFNFVDSIKSCIGHWMSNDCSLFPLLFQSGGRLVLGNQRNKNKQMKGKISFKFMKCILYKTRYRNLYNVAK